VGGWLAQFVGDAFVEQADELENGACGRQERHDSAGMRLVSTAKGWRPTVRRSTDRVAWRAGQSTKQFFERKACQDDKSVRTDFYEFLNALNRLISRHAKSSHLLIVS
jgi:hypothetical protein